MIQIYYRNKERTYFKISGVKFVMYTSHAYHQIDMRLPSGAYMCVAYAKSWVALPFKFLFKFRKWIKHYKFIAPEYPMPIYDVRDTKYDKV